MVDGFTLIHIHYFKIGKSQSLQIKITSHLTTQRQWLIFFPSL